MMFRHPVVDLVVENQVAVEKEEASWALLRAQLQLTVILQANGRVSEKSSKRK
jgi:hypothetical protein